MEKIRSPVGRPDFKSGKGRQSVLGGFDSHSFPPTIINQSCSRLISRPYTGTRLLAKSADVRATIQYRTAIRKKTKPISLHCLFADEQELQT